VDSCNARSIAGSFGLNPVTGDAGDVDVPAASGGASDDCTRFAGRRGGVLGAAMAEGVSGTGYKDEVPRLKA